jgi:AbrB family looped-hinge helix DNA binding protein
MQVNKRGKFSLCVTIPKGLCTKLGIQDGSQVEMSECEGGILIRKVN